MVERGKLECKTRLCCTILFILFWNFTLPLLPSLFLKPQRGLERLEIAFFLQSRRVIFLGWSGWGWICVRSYFSGDSFSFTLLRPIYLFHPQQHPSGIPSTPMALPSSQSGWNFWLDKRWLLSHIVKLLAKSKLKSLPYNHTAHPTTHPTTHNSKSSLYKSIQVLHQHMRYH